MEKDIEILERYLKGDILYVTELDKAIENLINRVKELEIYYRDMEEVNKKFIAVDKIKEKIDELNINMAEQLKIITEFGEHEKNRAKLTMYKEQRDILQELLEEK